MKERTLVYGMSERINECCAKTGKTDNEIGMIIGKHRKTILSYRNGHTSPDSLALGKMAKLFGVTADYLIFG